jgi:hypothetical protein
MRLFSTEKVSEALSTPAFITQYLFEKWRQLGKIYLGLSGALRG